MQKKHRASPFSSYPEFSADLLRIFQPLSLHFESSAALCGAGYDSEAGCLK